MNDIKQEETSRLGPVQAWVIPHTLSRDYDKLFEMICNNNQVAAFVDYSFDKDDPNPCRDVCKVRRGNPFQIQIAVRGMTYASVDPWIEESGWDEKEYFKRTCEAINLEFIEV